MSARRHLTQAQKEAKLTKQNNRCAGCGSPLISGLFQWDHIQDRQFEGDEALDNFQALCTCPPYRCHQAKTARAKKAKSRATRVRVGKPHKGRESKPIDGSKLSKWRKPFHGPAVLR